MRTSIAIISALAATAAANVAYSTVDVTITSCAPEGERYLSGRQKKKLHFGIDDLQLAAAQEGAFLFLNKPRPCTKPLM